MASVKHYLNLSRQQRGRAIMEQGYSINDLADYTGLKIDFIRKCVKAFEDVLEEYQDRGDKNSLLFDSNALVIFDRIKQLKEKNYTINVIGDYLRRDMDDAEEQRQEKEKDETGFQMKEYMGMMMQEIKESHRMTMSAKDETIRTQKSQINTLESKILLLTDGKSPEEIKRQQEEEQRKKTIDLQTQLQVQQQRMNLLMELESLEGQLFKAKRRKEIFQELRALN